MRIACISSSWPDRQNPSAGAFVRDHARVLERAGHDVSIFTWRQGDYDEPVHTAAGLGRYSLFNADGAPDALDRAPWRAAEAPVAIAAMLAELARHPRFDLYLGHWLVPGGLVARLAGDRVGRPSAVIGHSAGVHALARLPGPLRRRLTRYIARPESTTVPSMALAVKLGATVDVLPMGFDPVAAVGGGDGVLAYGRLVYIKGFDRALGALHESGAAIHVVGSGPEESTLRRLAPEATFWGWADGAMKAEVFAQCDRAVFPSRVLPGGRHEGWPVSVLEVASAGVVPFVGRWPGAQELVVEPSVQLVDEAWGDITQADVSALRQPMIEKAQRFRWAALEPQWVEWVECAASLRTRLR